MIQHKAKRCRAGALIVLPLLCSSLMACASWRDSHPVFEGWPEDGESATRQYLTGLREYLGRPAGEQAAHRERLRLAAEHEGPAAALEYAFALSVDRDNRASLEQARENFEALLAEPDPLPVALDALVRLQLGQVIDRLERMQVTDDMRAAYRSAASGQKICFAQLRESEAKLDDMRGDLSEVRRKLDALARIEQTVNQEPQPGEETEDNGESDNDAERKPGTARR